MDGEDAVQPLDPHDPSAALARGRMFEVEMGEVEPVTLADDRAEGGYLIQVHPSALRDMERFGLTPEMLVEEFRRLARDGGFNPS